MQSVINQTDEIEAEVRAYVLDYERFPCGVGVIKNDDTFTLLKANPAFYKVIGHTKEDFQQNHENRMTDILMDYFANTSKKYTHESDYEFEWDLRVRAADTSIRWIHDVAHYNAKLNVFFVVYTDITDKMIGSDGDLSYDAFRTKHEIMRYLSKQASKYFIVTDLVTDEVVYMSTSAMKASGLQQESDWRGKTHFEIGFGDRENVRSSYYEPLQEGKFAVHEYYNQFHKKYVRTESTIIFVPALDKKLRFTLIYDITAQKQLEQKIEMQNTLHNCIEPLFTAGTTDKNSRDAYYDILSQLKSYYQADGAFFYKFIDGTHEVEAIYKVLADGVKSANIELPMTMSDEQIQAMQAISNATPDQNQTALDSFDENYRNTLQKHHAKYQIHNYTCVAVHNKKGDIAAFMGVTNPGANENTKELMVVLSRFICMLIEHEQDNAVKEEAHTLETISKKNLLEQSAKNFVNANHADDNIANTLDALCHHYEAGFAIIISRTENGAFDVTHTSSGTIPDLSGLRKAGHIMGGWLGTFQKHKNFASDLDFDDAKSPIIKKMLRDKFGIHNFVASPMRDASGALTGLLILNNLSLTNRSHLMVHVVSKDIADYMERVRMQKTIQLEPTTQLTNKVATENRISHMLDTGSKGTLFVIDIDNFKQLNDTLGHQIGDQAILDIAAILKKVFRASDVIGRVGGDEFMVFSPSLTADNLIAEKARKLQEKCRHSYQNDEFTAEISVSVGICSVADNHKTFHSLYAKADYALYCSKRNGKDQHHIYTTTAQDADTLCDCTNNNTKETLSWWKRMRKR